MSQTLIEIDSKRYSIDPESWRGRDVNDFAPRASVPGSGVVYSSLDLYQPLAQVNWQRGFGYQWATEEAGYLRTVGNIDTRHEGLVMLFTKATSSDTDDNYKEGAVVFGSFIYFWGEGGVRRYSTGGGWEAVPIQADPQPVVNVMFTNGAYLFACPNATRIRKAATISATPVAGDWSDAGAGVNSTDYRWAQMHGGSIYLGKDALNDVYSDTTDDLSVLYGVPADDTQEIQVGAGTIPTTMASSFNEQLMVGRQDALFAIGEDRVARVQIDFGALRSSNNFRSMAVLGGRLMFPIRDRIFQWNGTVLVNQTPRKLTTDFPYTTYGRFDNFVVVDPFMFCTGRTNETTYTESILVFDGIAWHRLLDPITNGTGSITMLAYDPLNHRLWFHVDTGAASGNTTYYIPFQAESDFPYADFPTTGTHRLITSRVDGGFRQITKSAPRMFVTTQNCDAGTYINIYLGLDGETEVLWRRITTNGVSELLWPLGLMSVEFDYCNIIFELVTDTAAQSPIMEGYALMVITRPGTKWGYSFNVHAASYATEGAYIDARDAKSIKDDLRASRQSAKPIKLLSPFGEEIWGYITSLSESAQEAQGDIEGGVGATLEMEIIVNFVEVITPSEGT